MTPGASPRLGLSRFAVLALAAAALLGACTKHMDNEAMASPPPLAGPEKPVLMGGPETEAGPRTAADAAASRARAAEDVYIASLPPGLLTAHRIDPVTGQTVLVVFNPPVANPHRGAYRWAGQRHHTVLAGAPRHHNITVASTSGDRVQPIVVEKPKTLETPTPQAAIAPPAPMAAALPTPAVHPASATAPNGDFHGLTLSPGMWIAAGVLLLAIIILVMLARGKRKSRYDNRPAHA